MSFEDILASVGDGQFTDSDFPPSDSSLIANWDNSDVGDPSQWKEFQWIRASEIGCLKDSDGNQKIFEGKIEPNDIKQGQLGDCYFLSTLSVLTEHPERIMKLFATDQVNPQGVYGINMCKNGEYQTVIVDDHIPCNSGNDAGPCFSKGNGPELWVILLEKAWAKIHGSYERVIGGQAHLTMRDLTGAPSYEIMSSDEDAFEKILDGEKKNYAMSSGINSKAYDEAQAIKDMGLVAEHSYGLISAAEVIDKNGNPVKLVKLRNPWGNFEWKGDWGDESDCWTDELKEQLQLDVEADDGTFWMDFEEMKRYFSRIQIGKVVDSYHFSSVKIDHTECAYSLVNFTVPESGEYTLSISQKGERMFPRGSNYQYSNCRMIVAKKTDKSPIYVRGEKGFRTRDAYIHFENLEQGDYCMFVEFDWEPETEERTFCVTSYGASKVEFGDCIQDAPREQILSDLFKGKAIQAEQDPDAFPDVKISDFTDEGGRLIKKYECSKSGEGYQWVIVINNEAEASYQEDVQFPTFEGMELLPPYEGNTYVLKCGPGEWKIVIIRCQPSYSMSKSYLHKVTQGSSALVAQCLAEGTSQERVPGIAQYKLKHSAGLMFIYKNDTSDKILVEELGLNLDGLVIADQEDQTKVDIRIGPGEQKVINLTTTGGGYSFGSSSSYTIEDA